MFLTKSLARLIPMHPGRVHAGIGPNCATDGPYIVMPISGVEAQYLAGKR